MILKVMEPRPINPLVLWAMLICLLPWSEAGGQAQNRAASPKATVTPPPIPTQAGSPIDFFRQLITAKPEEREKLLMRKAPDSPELRKKLEEHALRYQNELSAEERELRLRNMELRYHLTSLLHTAPSNRMERLKLVPDRDRPLVEYRLKQWDGYSAEQQAKVLSDERLTREIIGAGIPRTPLNHASLTGQASNQAVRIEKAIIPWQLLPDSRRDQVQKFFELTDAEIAREKLQTLQFSQEERQLMEQTLAQFKQFQPAQRSACVKNFSKLASLSPAERREFLVNAGEWQKMKPEDREAWRKLVSKVPPLPPLPQRYRLPPLPTARSLRASPATTVQTTN
jgi:hypothetical protein